MLAQRVATAVALLVVTASLLFCAPQWLWSSFSALAALAVAWEASQMSGWGIKGGLAYVAATAAAIAAMAGLAAAEPAVFRPLAIAGAVAALAFWLAAVPAALRLRPRFEGRIWTALIGWLVALPFWAAMSSLRDALGPWGLLALMAAAWVADTGAFFVGRSWGKRKLAPNISPGKTWEGVWGAAALCVAYAYFALFALGIPIEPNRIAPIALGALGACAVTVEGDLFESHFKRVRGVKDSGKALPGHGGVWDRVDSLAAWLATFAALRFLILSL